MISKKAEKDPTQILYLNIFSDALNISSDFIL